MRNDLKYSNVSRFGKSSTIANIRWLQSKYCLPCGSARCPTCFEWSLHIYNFHFAKSEEISKKLDDKKKRVLESFGANLPYYYLFLAFLHQFCETYSTKQLETSQYDVEDFFGGDQ